MMKPLVLCGDPRVHEKGGNWQKRSIAAPTIGAGMTSER
jgi:hypothetical protein